MKERQKGFTKECSLMMKGVLVILMLTHHLFCGLPFSQHEVDSFINSEQLFSWAAFGKVCLSGFAFISAYGLSKCFMKNGMGKEYIKGFYLKNLVKLESIILFIYPIAVLYRRFVVGDYLRELYLVGGKFSFIYMLIDATGLTGLFNTPLFNPTWWYMTFAILLILCLPAFLYIYQKIGPASIALVYLLSPDKLIVMIIWGVAFANDNWFEKLQELSEKTRLRQILSFIACIVILYCGYRLSAESNHVSINLWWGGVFIAYVTMMFLQRVPILSHILRFIGKYATNIFLVHTFIYLLFYEEFIYSFKKAWLILLVLLGISLGVSILIELLKKVIGYNRLVNYLLQKIERPNTN